MTSSTLADYIARDNPVRARTFVAEVRTARMGLGDTPLAFPVVPRHAESEIRRRPFGRYLIFYRVMPDRVAIVHILHSAQDYEPLLFPEP
jgi:toxin ParE1/3/4